MKKLHVLFCSAAISALMCASSAYAKPLVISQSHNNFDPRADFIVAVTPGSASVHDVLIAATGQTKDYTESKAIDWSFVLDGNYWGGIRNAVQELDYAQVTVLRVNGVSVSGPSCSVTAQKRDSGLHNIVIKANDNGSYSCVQLVG